VLVKNNIKWVVPFLVTIFLTNLQFKLSNGLTVAGTLTAACAKKIRVSIGESVGDVTFYWEINNGSEQNPNWERFSRTDLNGNEDFFEDDNELRGIDPGSYRVSVTDEAGNEVRDIRLTLTEPYDLRADIDFAGLICQDDPNSGLALINFLNGPPPMDWTLTGPNTNLTGQESGSKLAIQDLEVGTYTLDWVSGDECTGQTTFTIVAPSAVTGTINILNNVSCPGGNDGQVEFTFTGGWEENKDPKIYFTEIVRDGVLVQNWAPQTSSDGVVYRSNLEAGSYTVNYTDRINEELIIQNLLLSPFTNYVFETKRFDCINQLNFTITEPDPFELNLTSTVAVCQGATNGEIAITPSGGTPNYDISFYAGHFDDPDNPVVDNNDMTLLAGSPVTNVNVGQEVNKTDLGAGDYAVLLEDANGCLKAENLTIIANPLGQVDAINDITACSGDVITQAFTTSEATGTTRYEWVNSDPAIGLATSGDDDISFTGTNTTNAPVTATITVTPFYSNYGVECEGPTESFKIIVNPEPVGIASFVTVCSDESFDVNPQENIDDTANGGNGVSSSFSWVVTNINGTVSGVELNDASTGSITGTATNKSNTVAVIEYTVTPMANTTGCAGDEFTVTVTVDPEPVGVSSTEDVCSDEPFSFDPQDNIDDTGNGGNGVASAFAWVVSDITGSVTGASIGDLGTGNITGTLTNTSSAVGTVEYTITPTSDPEGCEGEPFTITVTVNPEPVVSDQTVGPVCSDQPLGANFNSSTSVAAATYNITNIEFNGLTVSAGGAAVANGLTAADLADDAFTNTTNAPVNVVYTVVPLTSGGCEGQSFTVTATINPEPVVDPMIIPPVCSVEAINVTLNDDADGPSVANYNLIDIAPESGLTAGGGNQAIGNDLPANAIVNDTWKNLTSAALDVVYTFVPIGDNGCPGDEFTVTVTVDPEPVGVNSEEEVSSNVAYSFDPQDNINDTGNGGNGVSSSFIWEIISKEGTFTGADVGDTGTGNVSGTLVNTSTNIASVTYRITPTSTASGCEGAPFEIKIIVNPEPIVNDQTVDPVCSDQPLGANFNSSTSVAVATYNITNIEFNGLTVSAGGAAVANGLTAADLADDAFTNTTNAPVNVVYTVVPLTSGGCEGQSFTVTATINPEPVVDPMIIPPVCSVEAINVTLNDDADGPSVANYNLIDIAPESGLTAGGGNQAIGNDLPANAIVNDTWKNLTSAALDVVYTFVPIGDNGCPGDEFTVTVTVDPEPVVSDQFLTVCSEGASGIDFNGSTTVAAATYNITNLELNGLTVFAGNPAVGNGLKATDLADDAFTNTTNGAVDVVYTVVPVSAGGCQGDSFLVTITVEPEPVIEDKIAALICSGETFKVEPMQGVDGDNVPVGTKYTWTVVDNPNVDGESDEILISQSEISQTLVNTTNNIEEVIYTVVPVTSNGCQGESFIISVTVNPEIQDNATVTNILCSYSDPLCAGSIEVNPVGIGPFSFYWSSSNGNVSRPENQNQYNLCPGDYSLQITDSSGCIQYFEYTITPPEPLEVNLISLVDMSCNNIGLNCDGYIELDIKGGTLPYKLKEFYTEKIPGSGQFDLLVQAGSNILNNACKGNYVFKVIDNNGCELISPIYAIKETASPINVTEEISNYNGYEISCSGTNDGFINVSLSGGSGSYSYNLSPGMILDNDLSTPNILEFENLKAGKYTLTITDNNCPNNIILEYDLKEPSQLSSSSDLISDPINCFGGKEVYKVSASGGTAPYRGTGNYTLTAGVHSIKVTDANGCEITETITVTEPNDLTATAIVTDPILCNGEMGEVTITASGGTAPYKGTGVFNVKSGDFIFTVTDANGCTYSNNIFVNEPTELSFTIDSIENPTCSPDWSYSNGSICITITGGTNPSPIGSGWTSLGGGVWCLNGLSAGTYKIDVDDVNNCSTNTDIKEVVLTRPPVINAQITSTVTEDCDNNAMIQTNYLFINGGSPPYEITWSGGNICNPSNPQCMETTESGTYIAYIHDQESLTNGCPPIEVEVIVDLPEIGDASFSYSSANTSFCNILSFNELITFNNESTGDIINFYWDFGDGSPLVSNVMNPTHSYKTAGSYKVSLTVEYESNCCKETYSEVINVTKGYELETPNSFTPNKDGINDTIRPLFSCMQNVKMYIYDTLGALVYFEEGSDLKGWDGYIKNIPAENGNYLMLVNALTFNGQEIKKHTPILLIR